MCIRDRYISDSLYIGSFNLCWRSTGGSLKFTRNATSSGVEKNEKKQLWIRSELRGLTRMRFTCCVVVDYQTMRVMILTIHRAPSTFSEGVWGGFRGSRYLLRRYDWSPRVYLNTPNLESHREMPQPIGDAGVIPRRNDAGLIWQADGTRTHLDGCSQELGSV